ncbi:adhesion G-protein coupled receptor D2 isoform X2 [Amia ocellicauda]|uniref:adhesion G-protein coupled receptor D2 isoform X2 n=1 Tax=Amia ocellicauda TaxID=2972642 RepID=UPI003464CAB9
MTGNNMKSPFLLHLLLVCSITEKHCSWASPRLWTFQDFNDTLSILETPQNIFQFVNESLDFWQANRFCQRQFSELLCDNSKADVEYATELLQAVQAEQQVWLKDVAHQIWKPPPYIPTSALHFQKKAHAMYAKVNIHFPPLPTVTVCARVQWDRVNAGVSTVFSYSTPKLINEFQLRGQPDEHGSIMMALLVHSKHMPYKALFKNDGKWHHVCVTWQKKDGNWAIYVNGERKHSGNGTEISRDIYGYGIFIIGQDQDSFGGNFTEPFTGNITSVSIWNNILHEQEIRSLSSCSPIKRDLLFNWNLKQMTIEHSVQTFPANLWCERPGSEHCKTIHSVPSQPQVQHSTISCEETLSFVCKHNKETYFKIREIKEVHGGKPSQFTQHLMQLSNSTMVGEGFFSNIPKDLSFPEVHTILNISQQALRHADKDLHPLDLLSLVQLLSQACHVQIGGNESKDAIGNLSAHFITIAGSLFNEENANDWLAIKQIVNGPMTVVQSIDRMVANLNPQLMAGKSKIAIDRKNIKLEVQHKTLSLEGADKDFYGLTSTDEAGVDSISIPADMIQKFHQRGVQNITLINTWYGSLLPLFRSENNTIQFPAVIDGSQKYLGTVLGSSVISTTVLGDNHPMNTSVYYELQHRLKTPAGTKYEPICAFWDFNLKPESGGSWSTKGCFVISLSYKSTSCFCNHTTNFALLLQIYEVQRSPADESALRLLSFIGCGVSLCGLTMTFILFIALGVPNSDRTTVHKNLIFALATAELLLMFSDLASSNKALCTAVTALLHLFFMASFTWMLVEGLLLWSKVVLVNISEDRRMKLYYVIGWGLPIVIVSITLATSFNKYVADNYCWLNTQNDIIWAFVGPVVFVLAVNTVVLFRVVTVTVASARRRSKMLTPSSASKLHALDLTWAATKPVIILLPVLGLTWICGILVHLTVVLAYIFIIMNAFQGLYIFLVYAVYNSEVRNAIKIMKEKKKALSFTNCSQPISFLTSQRTTSSWDNGKAPPSTSESNESSTVRSGSPPKKSLVIKNESFRKDSFVIFSLKPDSENQAKLKAKHPRNKQELKTAAGQTWQSITREETQHLVISMGSRLQAVIDCKGFAHHI